VERGPGITTTPNKTSYSPAAGTAYIKYENVKVPVGNLLGEVLFRIILGKQRILMHYV
jgi:hypothetical protein